MTTSSPADSRVGIVIRQVGGFYAMTIAAVRGIFARPFQLREFLEQSWFIASVSIGPAILVAVPFCGIAVFQMNQLLGQFGAKDLAGAGSGLAVIREIGPMASVLVVAGAGATALCADLGARKIREEIDAMEVLALHPVPRLVTPRVLASTLVAICLNFLVATIGLLASFVFSVYVQGASGGLFFANLTLLTKLSDFLVSIVKAGLFGFFAGLIGCYLGLNAKGGPKGVGEAVNQTVVFSFMALFAANSIISGIFLQGQG